MDLLGLFWNFNANDSTKIIAFFIFIVLMLCIICKPKKKRVTDGFSERPTKCQIDYKMCQENSKRGNNNKNVCHLCKSNGDYPDKIYKNGVGWIKLNPKSGKPTN